MIKPPVDGVLGVVSHDAGGAELVSSYVRRNQLKPVFSLAGPAVGIFEKKLGEVIRYELEQCLELAESLLCSLGWSELEWYAIQRAKKMQKHVTVFLDHWTGYGSRFERDGEVVLPDEIWVGDVHAEMLARETFPAIPVKLVPNPYYEDLREELDAMPAIPRVPDSGIKILYLCEPTAPEADSLRGSGYSDHAALQYFLDRIGQCHEKIESISLRPHPTENPDKYAWTLQRDGLTIRMSDTVNLLSDIHSSDWIVGRSSMALVVGVIAGKKVFSCIPPGGKPCTLPCDGILDFDRWNRG